MNDGCDYCVNSKSLFLDRNFRNSIKEIYIEQDGSLTVSSHQTFEDEDYDVNIKINYCPMCGRKLVDKIS